jgi:hypothetical protein
MNGIEEASIEKELSVRALRSRRYTAGPWRREKLNTWVESMTVYLHLKQRRREAHRVIKGESYRAEETGAFLMLFGDALLLLQLGIVLDQKPWGISLLAHLPSCPTLALLLHQSNLNTNQT